MSKPMRYRLVLAAYLLGVCLIQGACPTTGFAQANAEERARASKPQPTEPTKWEVESTRGVVVAGGQEAVEAGAAVLRSGGNAADAAAATLLTLTVTDANQFCFGGEVPIMIYDAERQGVEVLAGQGAAPRLATAEHFRQLGGIPGSGPLSATVPASLDACLTLLARHGTRSFAASAGPMLGILDRGEFPWHTDLARTIRRLIAAEQVAGSDRQRGLRLVADFFYRGPVAREIDEWSQGAGALLRYTDLATHVTRVEEPVTADYRGYTVYKCGIWTQGPYLLQALRLLEGFDLAALGHNHPQTIHLAVETLKLALADRDVHFGDPLFADIPLHELLATSYADLRRPLIDLLQASLEVRPGDPRGGKALLAAVPGKTGANGNPHDTTTCLVADSRGNVIAATPSGWTGSLIGRTGVWLGSRMQSFNLQEGSPNCLTPGKRPRITLSPTLVLKDGRPRIAVSVAGGDGQDQLTLQLLTNVIDFGLEPAAAVTAPRFETKHFTSSFRQVPPDLGLVRINADVGPPTLDALQARGHRVTAVQSAIWIPSLLTIDPQTKLIRAAGDPKAGRHAAAQ
jgi:gamma-glutamyltranspeptidase / glutathione hydrolase